MHDLLLIVRYSSIFTLSQKFICTKFVDIIVQSPALMYNLVKQYCTQNYNICATIIVVWTIMIKATMF